MVKAGFYISISVTAAVMSFGSCLKVASQPLAEQVQKTVSMPADLSTSRRASLPRVYLLRGLLNVFSLGMDQLAAELRNAGFSATVANHVQWRGIAEEIAGEYSSGRRGPIVLIGHSLGADAIMSMAEDLGKRGIPVSLVVPFDGISSHQATANVARVLNLYKNKSIHITRGPGFHGELTNVYVSDVNTTHFNIDKNPRLHVMVINRIKAIRPLAPHSKTALENRSSVVIPQTGKLAQFARYLCAT